MPTNESPLNKRTGKQYFCQLSELLSPVIHCASVTSRKRFREDLQHVLLLLKSRQFASRCADFWNFLLMLGVLWGCGCGCRYVCVFLHLCLCEHPFYLVWLLLMKQNSSFSNIRLPMLLEGWPGLVVTLGSQYYFGNYWIKTGIF